MKIQEWTFEEVKQVLDDNRTASEIAQDMRNRSTGAVYSLRNLATQYQKGKGSYITKNIREHLEKYYVNKGDMNLEPMQKEEKVKTSFSKKWQTSSQEETVIKQTTEDTCEKQIDEIVATAEQHFESLKDLMTQLAKTSMTHEHHERMQEIEELRDWKEKHEPELIELRTFKDTAKQSNFASTLRRVTRLTPRNQ